MFQDARHFIRISRPLNVLIAFFAFGVSCFIASEKSFHFLQEAIFWITAFTIAAIAATGYWINDVYDFRIDRINKPQKTVINAHLSVKKVLTIYFIINGLVLVLSLIYLGLIRREYPVTFINFLSVALLFIYASYLKRIGIPGNLTVSFLIAMVVILGGYLYGINTPLIWTIIFAFEITLIREITKDVEDIRGDLYYQLKTLPIQIGIRQTKKILGLLYILFIISCYLPFLYGWLKHDVIIWPYLISSIVLVQIPAVYLFYLLTKSARPEDFGQQSRWLKWLMILGIFTLFFLY